MSGYLANLRKFSKMPKGCGDDLHILGEDERQIIISRVFVEPDMKIRFFEAGIHYFPY
jgi:hypothetical protein